MPVDGPRGKGLRVRDVLEAGLVYVPFWIAGRLLAAHTDADPVVVGWIAGGAATIVRMATSGLLRR